MADFSRYSEQSLLTALQAGDDAAFTEIYHRYFDLLYTRAYKVLGMEQGADDAVQEVFLSLWKYRANLKIDNLGGYLHQSVRNAVVRSIRHQQADMTLRRRLGEATAQLAQTPTATAEAEYRETLARLINSLPPDQQKIYRLSRDEEFTYTEIAKELDISVKTVEKKMSATLKVLRKGVKQLLVLFSTLWGVF